MMRLPAMVYVATEPVNLHFSFDRLAGIVREQLGGCADDAGHIAAGVDHCIPAATVERLELPIAITGEFFCLGKESRRMLTTIEERHGVIRSEGGGGDMPAEKNRATEYEQVHDDSSAPILPTVGQCRSRRDRAAKISVYSCRSARTGSMRAARPAG